MTIGWRLNLHEPDRKGGEQNHLIVKGNLQTVKLRKCNGQSQNICDQVERSCALDDGKQITTIASGNSLVPFVLEWMTDRGTTDYSGEQEQAYQGNGRINCHDQSLADRE